MKHQKKFEAQEQQQVSEVHSEQTSAREFATAEELLRYDAKQTEVPPGIAQRLGQSLQKEPRPRRSWWRRWFGAK
jgi:uncharacterized membrane protein YcjF (UPF0283 family)